MKDKTWQRKIFMPMDRRDNLVDLVLMLNPSYTDTSHLLPKSYPNGASFRFHGYNGSNCADQIMTDITVNFAGTCNERQGADAAGKAMFGWKHVETLDSKENNLRNHDSGNPFERKTVCEGPAVLFDRADGSFYHIDVIVGSHGIETNRQDVSLDTFKFAISSKLRDNKTSGSVKLLDLSELLQKGSLGSIGELSRRTKLELRRNGMKKWDALDIEIVNTHSDLTMVLKN